jgi:hypothetical protein
VTTEPQAGDVLLRGDVTYGFQLVDAMTHQVLAGPITTLEAVVELARGLGARAIWQQSVDNRGRPLGDPFRLLHPPQESKTAV